MGQFLPSPEWQSLDTVGLPGFLGTVLTCVQPAMIRTPYVLQTLSSVSSPPSVYTHTVFIARVASSQVQKLALALIKLHAVGDTLICLNFSARPLCP